MITKKSKQDMNSDYDIMIVGGGPAGLSTWLHLHKSDPLLASKAVLIEKEKYPRDKLCGGALHKWMTQRILSDLEIKLKVPFVSVDNIEIRFEKDVYRHQEEDFFRIVRRIEFDHFLAQIAKERGLCLRENEACIDIEYIDDGVMVKTNKSTYKVKMLIGADGALSMVRRKMKPPLTPRFAATIEIFSPAHEKYDPEFATHTALMDFTPVNEGLQGYVWHFPCLLDNAPFMNHGICDTRIYSDAPRGDLKKIFLNELQLRHNNHTSKLWSSHPVTYFLNDVPLSRPNILLVGDAAGIEPLLGGGIHLSLAYGEVATTTIIDAIRRDDFSFKTYNQTLQNHYLGRYIKKFTSVAKYVYGDKTKILDSLARIIQNK
jgi:flavin-dependent dehydrogenase